MSWHLDVGRSLSERGHLVYKRRDYGFCTLLVWKLQLLFASSRQQQRQLLSLEASFVAFQEGDSVQATLSGETMQGIIKEKRGLGWYANTCVFLIYSCRCNWSLHE